MFVAIILQCVRACSNPMEAAWAAAIEGLLYQNSVVISSCLKDSESAMLNIPSFPPLTRPVERLKSSSSIWPKSIFYHVLPLPSFFVRHHSYQSREIHWHAPNPPELPKMPHQCWDPAHWSGNRWQSLPCISLYLPMGLLLPSHRTEEASHAFLNISNCGLYKGAQVPIYIL